MEDATSTPMSAAKGSIEAMANVKGSLHNGETDTDCNSFCPVNNFELKPLSSEAPSDKRLKPASTQSSTLDQQYAVNFSQGTTRAAVDALPGVRILHFSEGYPKRNLPSQAVLEVDDVDTMTKLQENHKEWIVFARPLAGLCIISD